VTGATRVAEKDRTHAPAAGPRRRRLAAQHQGDGPQHGGAACGATSVGYRHVRHGLGKDPSWTSDALASPAARAGPHRGPRRGVRPWTRWTREQQTWQAEDRGRGGLEVDAPASLRLLRARGPSSRLAKATAREQGERRPQAASTVALAPVASSGVRTSHFLCRLAVGPQGKTTDGALLVFVAGSRARGLAVSSRRRPLAEGTPSEPTSSGKGIKRHLEQHCRSCLTKICVAVIVRS
jgi:hypothetical protein